ncbi:hypothetical protein ACWDSD_36880 [Streptomyces spiralis]
MTSCIAVGETYLYLATMTDIGSIKVVGWSFAAHMHASLATYAIEMVVAARVNGAVFRTDEGHPVQRGGPPKDLPTA